jgi:hypothetical protein
MEFNSVQQGDTGIYISGTLKVDTAEGYAVMLSMD